MHQKLCFCKCFRCNAAQNLPLFHLTTISTKRPKKMMIFLCTGRIKHTGVPSRGNLLVYPLHTGFLRTGLHSPANSYHNLVSTAFFALKMVGEKNPRQGCQNTPKIFPYVQDCTQVLLNKYFIFDSVIFHLHITSYVTELGALW